MTDPPENTSERSESTIRKQLFHADLDRNQGETNVQMLGIDVYSVVFPLSVLALVVFIALTIGLDEQASMAYETVFDYVNRNFGWLYVLAVNMFMIALVAFGSGRYGNIRVVDRTLNRSSLDSAGSQCCLPLAWGLDVCFRRRRTDVSFHLRWRLVF